MAIFKCKMCGGTLDISENATTATCDYCGSQQTLPKLNDDKISRLYDRANHFRRNNEFDKAMGIYEQILDENNQDAESYWSIVLCRYGIEYVEDPTTHKRIPTVNRAQFTSIFDDDNYRSALKYADSSQRVIYEQEAKTINEIQKGILEISQKEEPFDVFICYKETDENGQRTRDSVYANDLYYQLTQEGFKVFYARITLEDKLGVAYEPYIFAALNSAKIMVVIGTKQEYFNAVWVKNEWSRYLSLIKNGAKKVLIPAYSGIDPYDLPQEFSHLQAQDMTKLGFMPDLVRGIKKIIGVEQPKPNVQNNRYNNVKGTVNRSEAETLLKRVKIFLDNQDWVAADAKCEAILDLEPENANAYIFKLLAQLHISEEEQLENCSKNLEQFPAYRNALRYADKQTSERLTEYNRKIKDRLNKEQQRLQAEQIELEKRKKALEAKEKELKALFAAKNNATQLITSQVAEKERLERLIQSNTSENVNFKDTSKKIKKLSFGIFALAAVTLLILIIGIAGAEMALPFVIVTLIANVVVTVLLSIKTKESPVLEGVKCYFTFGICGVILAKKSLKKCKTNTLPQENMALTAQLQAIEQQLNASRHSLSEINHKIEMCKSK